MSRHPLPGALLFALLLNSAPLVGLRAQSSALSVPTFSVPRSHVTEPFTLEVAAPAPGVALLVTTDGSRPSAEDGRGRNVPAPPGAGVARVEIPVDRTMTVRAMAVADGGESGAVASHSYIFVEQVLRQGAPAGASGEWGHSGPDWEMDPEVVGHPDPESRVVAADLLSIPTVVLSVPFDELFGPDGIYIEGEGEPRETSVELLNPAGDAADPNALAGLQVDGTVEVTGGSSTDRWKTDKLSLRLRFRGGAEFPVFDHAPTHVGDGHARRFHTLILDARLNESWLHPDPAQQVQGQHVRDQFVADMQNSAGGRAPRGRFVHLYLSGLYWGLYTLHERPDHHFAEVYRGGDSSDWTVMKHDRDDVVHGDKDPYDDLRDLMDRRDIDTPETLARIEAILELGDFARYMLLNYWAGNRDWSHQNWYASYHPGLPEGKWLFHAWDSELTLLGVDDDVTERDDEDSPTRFHRRLMRNPAYAELFGQVVDEARQPGGILDPEHAASLYRARAGEIDGATRAESARWGDNRRTEPYTRGGEWSAELRRLLDEYFPRRAEIVLKQLRSQGWSR